VPVFRPTLIQESIVTAYHLLEWAVLVIEEIRVFRLMSVVIFRVMVIMRVMICFTVAMRCSCSVVVSLTMAGSRVHIAHQSHTAQETQCSPTKQHIYYARRLLLEAVVDSEKLKEARFAG
jgi:hypothetical protein